MKLLDIMNSAWAIVPDKLHEIQSIYLTHLRGEKIDIKKIEAQIGKPLDNQAGWYEVNKGVAVLPIDGVIAKRMNMFQKISGGTSTELATKAFQAAMNDPDVNSILLSIDSPGGAVDGTQEFASVIYDARGAKPIIAHSNGMMASAAYWIGAAADAIYISGDTVDVGSIGVVAEHIDVSKAEELQGYKTTEIYAGKYKRVSSQYAPLTDQGRANIQDMVDYIYGVFVKDVAKFRGQSVDAVIKDMADGRLFIGKQAIKAGLVDGMMTLDVLINKLAAGDAGLGSKSKTVAIAGDASQQSGKEDVNMMDTKVEITKELIEKEYSVIAEAFRTEGYLKGADAERERIKSVEAQLIPGHEALINDLKFDGKTSGPEAAVKILQAEKGIRAAKLEAIIADSPSPVAQPAAVNDIQVDANATPEEKAKSAWEKSADLRAEFGNDFVAYMAYERACNAGLVKILTK